MTIQVDFVIKKTSSQQPQHLDQTSSSIDPSKAQRKAPSSMMFNCSSDQYKNKLITALPIKLITIMELLICSALASTFNEEARSSPSSQQPQHLHQTFSSIDPSKAQRKAPFSMFNCSSDQYKNKLITAQPIKLITIMELLICSALVEDKKRLKL